MLEFREVTLEPQHLRTGLSLLFAAGERPSEAIVESILAASDDAAVAATISHRPREPEGWLELLANGLTFELHGLGATASAPVTPPLHRFGLGTDFPAEPLEALALVPGPHIAGGRAMLPVVRAITGLASNLALLLDVRAVCWEPARIWMEPRYFTRLIVNWLAGGPFPALGLTAVMPGDDGTMTSLGLDYFCGQEVEVAPGHGELPAETAKLAVRVIDNLVRRGRIDRRTELDSPNGEVIIAEPSGDGKRVRVWRGR